MAFVNAQQSRVYAGPLNYSGYTTNFDIAVTVDALEVTTILDASKKFIVGQNDATATIALVLDTDTTTGGEWSNATTWKTTTPSPLTYAPSGVAALAECFMLNALETEFSTSSTHNAAVTGNIQAQADGGADAGTVVDNDLTAITVDGNGTARDGTAATSNGGVAHLHVTAFSGLTNNIVTIEHSVDGVSSWATLVTFATYTGITSERVVVAPATTVRRYLRAVDNVTGTGSTSRLVTFARR